MPVNYGSLPFQEAIDFFRSKLNVPTERWADIWREGHNTSFMIAGAMKDDLLNDFRKSVSNAIEEGKSITWFQKEFKNIVAKHGWSHTGDASWRADIIYDTNMRQSYNAGRYEQLQHFEYLEYKHGDSRQPRELHLKWDGILLPKDHPWWETHFPQNGWKCKCKTFGRSQAWVDRKKLKISQAPDDGVFEWLDKTTGEVHKVPKGIDPGFDYAPKKSEIKKRQKKLVSKKAKPFVKPVRTVPTAFSTVKGVDVHHLNKLLEDLKQTSAKPQIEKLGQFFEKNNTKTLFIKQSEMSYRNKASSKIASQIKDYLDTTNQWDTRWLYTIRNPGRVNGFTSRSHNHVVVKVLSGAQTKKIDQKDMIDAVLGAILKQRANNAEWSLSHIVRHYSASANHGGAIITWLHELGHQVHFKAGMPSPPVSTLNSITRYASKNEAEWHAEHFAAWVLNRKALADWDITVAEYFDDLINKVI